MGAQKSPARKPSYEELETWCRELQSKVTKGIVLQQELISIKDELDQELNRFRLIQEFGEVGMFRESIRDFATIATEYFIQAFEQPHCLLSEYRPEDDRLFVLSTFGFSGAEAPSSFEISPSHFRGREGFLLSQRPTLQQQLSGLCLEDALIAPLFAPDGAFLGVVAYGQKLEDQRFYNPIDPKDRYAFTVMATKVGYLLHNFRVNEQLKKEIEERKKVEKMLESKAEDLLRSNAELEQFAYVVSHDLKAPLRNAMGFARLLKAKHQEGLPSQAQGFLNVIWQELNRFSTIIDDLLAYARLSSSQLSTEALPLVDLNQVVERVIARNSFTIEQRKASIHCQPLPTLPAHTAQMEQLFQNLILNAIKFTPNERTPEIHILVRPEGASYCFSIQDNGIGIDKESQNQIFGLFQRLHASNHYEGNGLGLSICKKIVEQHKGKIWAQSQGKGKGAVFSFILPGK